MYDNVDEAHYITGILMISSCYYAGRHTGDRIHEMVERTLNTYAITKKVKYIITDNASNIRHSLLN